jgi:nucleoside-diphosphate-sugar epimerase
MHFITGGTGFVGSAIILELLEKTNQTIYCLVRPKKDTSGEERLYPLLKELVRQYQYSEELIPEIEKRCKVVEGDLTDVLSVDTIGIEKGEIKQFWHIAASLNYEERFRDEIFEINLEGTKYALEIAKRLGVENFNHFSTAYVAGKNVGDIKEVQITAVNSNNIYEVSKIEAENCVLSTLDFNTRIFRPSIVIGHSKTKYAFNFSGLYGFQRRLQQFKGMMERVREGYFEDNRVRMLAEPNATPNLIPVDMVAKNAVAAVVNNSREKIHHLTNPSMLTTREIMDIVFEGVGLTRPEFVDSKEEFNWVDEKFSEKVEFYLSYITGKKIFDRTNINNAIGAVDLTEYETTLDSLKSHCDWYLAKLNEGKAATPIFR